MTRLSCRLRRLTDRPLHVVCFVKAIGRSIAFTSNSEGKAWCILMRSQQNSFVTPRECYCSLSAVVELTSSHLRSFLSIASEVPAALVFVFWGRGGVCSMTYLLTTPSGKAERLSRWSFCLGKPSSSYIKVVGEIVRRVNRLWTTTFRACFEYPQTLFVRNSTHLCPVSGLDLRFSAHRTVQ